MDLFLEILLGAFAPKFILRSWDFQYFINLISYVLLSFIDLIWRAA